jgi:hypothetical protein
MSPMCQDLVHSHLHESLGPTFSLPPDMSCKAGVFSKYFLPILWPRGCETAGAPPTSSTNARGFYTLPSLFPQNTTLQFSASAAVITGAVPALITVRYLHFVRLSRFIQNFPPQHTVLQCKPTIGLSTLTNILILSHSISRSPRNPHIKFRTRFFAISESLICYLALFPYV